MARGQVEALRQTLDALAMDTSPDCLAQHISRRSLLRRPLRSGIGWRATFTTRSRKASPRHCPAGGGKGCALQGLSSEADEHVDRASDIARESLKAARRSVQALRPQLLEESDLCEALDTCSRG
jgi:hypothetical protein